MDPAPPGINRRPDAIGSDTRDNSPQATIGIMDLNESHMGPAGILAGQGFTS